MTPELWQRLKPLYNAALDLPKEGRSGYVEQMCGRDPELARELIALLSADHSGANTLAPPFHEVSHFLQPRPTILTPGTVLAGRFRIVRHLGSGGMGDVYEALDLQMEQGRIALKTVRPAIAGDPAALARFKDEVRLARQVTGPNVCRIHELYLTSSSEDAHCAAFLTMELLEGVTLHDRIAQSSPLPVPEIRAIAEQLCAALGCIHEAGIIHRDLKPRNVMLVPHHGAERAVVMDFGLARAAAGTPDLTGVSMGGPGMIVGTPSYMAPEQFEGGEVSTATDIYALGLILYELATGVQPFAAHTPLAAAVRRAKAPATASVVRSDLPAAWDEVITRCLQYDPAARLQSAAEVHNALKHPKRIVWRVGKSRRISISRRLLIAVCIALPLLCAATILLFVRSVPARALPTEAAHWNTLGMTALREGSYMKATRLLTMVTDLDPKYPVAHAALADAWAELDFTDAAEREMLRATAPAEQTRLTEPDRRYVDAVRNTLIRDYSAAAQDYEAILEKDPADRKADGYVDLGRIYEKAAKINQTVSAYEKAAQLNPDDPAPFLHLGILRSRLRDPQRATRAFDRAEQLYRAESDLEGLAEVAYQRGYAANVAGKFKEARTFLESSLSTAHQIPSPQLEARSLSQLSSVADNEDQEEQALEYARQASAVATENGLGFWKTDSLIRLGNAYLGEEKFAEAQASLQAALSEAHREGHPRLEALANLGLASLYDQRGQRSEQVSAALGALQYYQDYGFLDSADKALVLISRGEYATGSYEKALATDEQLLATATRAGSSEFIALGEEATGGVLLSMEQYPPALFHFQHALQVRQSQGRNPAYHLIHCAETLWRLGRYPEAKAQLAAISRDMRAREDIGSSMLSLEAQIQHSQGNEQLALMMSDAALRRFPKLRTDDFDLMYARANSLLRLSRRAEAKEEARQLAVSPYIAGNAWRANLLRLLQARIALDNREFQHAKEEAEAATSFFVSKNMRPSAAEALLLQAKIDSAMGDSASAVVLSQKSLDMWNQLQESWGVPTFSTYASRPDIHQLLREAFSLRGAKKD